MGVSDAEAEAISRSMANELMSPFCPGRTIASCPSKNARALEDFIYEQAKAGNSKADIEAQLVEQFGREKLGTKHDPVIMYGSAGAALVAAALLFAFGRRWMRRGSPAAAATTAAGTGKTAPAGGVIPGVSEDELARLESELDDLDEL